MLAQITALIVLLTTLPYGMWLVCAVGKLHADPGAENTGQGCR
ncbi:hypothetical protein OG563_44085 [Nocardia vinacea]|uniref:Uncharacterized protein n=1 Tax=Nocardia vinacea TaxID=96468 RepID=A0ABZ1YVQ2_9NOCA|nr:hypothetical protein [Nocardia vinacea]